MKDKIIELLKEHNEINLTDFKNLIPECSGIYAMYMPVVKGYNKNILLIDKVSKEFIETFNYLRDNKIIEILPANIMTYLFDNSPIYNLPLVDSKNNRKQTHCWQPTKIKINNNYE